MLDGEGAEAACNIAWSRGAALGSRDVASGAAGGFIGCQPVTTGTTQEVLAIRDQLNHEDQARVDGHLQRANQAALQLAQAALERQQAGQFDLPDPIRQPEWLKKKKVHGKAN